MTRGETETETGRDRKRRRDRGIARITADDSRLAGPALFDAAVHRPYRQLEHILRPVVASGLHCRIARERESAQEREREREGVPHMHRQKIAIRSGRKLPLRVERGAQSTHGRRCGVRAGAQTVKARVRVPHSRATTCQTWRCSRPPGGTRVTCSTGCLHSGIEGQRPKQHGATKMGLKKTATLCG